MKNESSFGISRRFVIFLLFIEILNAKPIDYEDVENLLPTEPQTTNDTLAAIVRDPVVQDAVHNTVGNGSLEGLVVKKKVIVMPAVEPTKVVSQREQVLVVPMMHLEDIHKNITETVNAKTDIDGLIFTDTQSATENDENGHTESTDISSYAPQHNNKVTEISITTRKPLFIDNVPQEIPYLVLNPTEGITPSEHPPVISVPIITFLDPAKISNDKIDMSIVAVLPTQDGTLTSQMENNSDKSQQNIPHYVDDSSWSTNINLNSFPSEMEVSSSLYEPTKQIKYANDISSENLLPVTMSRVDIVRPLFWTSDADIKYPEDPRDMEVAADIVFRPLFRYRQEVQRRSYRKSAYRRYNSYDSYPRRNYRYRQRYSDDYY